MARRSRPRKRTRKSSRSTASRGARRARSVPKSDPAEPRAPRSGIPSALARGLSAITGGMSDRLVTSGGVGIRVGKALLRSGGDSALRRDAGRTLRELRELAGLTIDDLADALEVADRSLLEAVEKGTATLSFELILRLAALVARNDPVPFVVQMTRSYNPMLWQLLQGWGIGRIPLQLERERRFVNVYRAHDVARKLSDAAFDHVLRFTQDAFEMALDFAAGEEGLREGGRPAARKPSRPRKARSRATRRR